MACRHQNDIKIDVETAAYTIIYVFSNLFVTDFE
jgi:hypothetical protein